VVLVGEAAGLVSPSSAEGISFALESGAALAAGGVTGAAARYRAAAAPLRRKVLSKVLKGALLYRPSLRNLVLASGIGAVPVGPLPSPASRGRGSPGTSPAPPRVARAGPSHA